MKKTILLVLSVTLLLGCISCSKKNKKENNSGNTTAAGISDVTTDGITDTAADKTETTTEPVSENTPEIPAEGEVTVYTESFVNGECSVSISYPRYGDGEHDVFDISMRNYALSKYTQSGMMPEDNALYEITSCEIKYESERFVSAVVCGHIINNTSAHDSSFAYAVNADPRNGRVYLSDELIADLEQMKAAMRDGSLTQAFGIEGLLQEITPDDITQSWRQDYGVFPDVYFTKECLGVLPELPQVLGGYAGFELPYAETESMITSAARELVA